MMGSNILYAPFHRYLADSSTQLNNSNHTIYYNQYNSATPQSHSTNNNTNDRQHRHKRARPDSPDTTDRQFQLTNHNNYNNLPPYNIVNRMPIPSSRVPSPVIPPSNTNYNLSHVYNTTTIRVEPYSSNSIGMYSDSVNDNHNKFHTNHDMNDVHNKHSNNVLLNGSTSDELHSSVNKYMKADSVWLNKLNKLYRMCIDSIIQLYNNLINVSCFKQCKHRYKNLSHDIREKLLFTISSIIGTILFLLLYESIHSLLIYSIELNTTGDTTFLLSYTISYLISIVWQHELNRILLQSVNNNQPTSMNYCISLLHTYTVYSASLLCVSLFGSLAIRYLDAPTRLITFLSIPFAGCINYYTLQNNTMNTYIESFIELYTNNNTNNSSINSVYVFTPNKNNISSSVTFNGTTPKSNNVSTISQSIPYHTYPLQYN